MAITKEALLKLADSQTQRVDIGGGDFVVIRRLKLAERNEILAEKRDGNEVEAGMAFTKAMVLKALVDPRVESLTELDELPAQVVDAISQAVMHLNGWTKEGQAAIADHFRAAPGAAV